MNAVMIDLETMSTRQDAAILTIGAVHFDPYGADTEASIADHRRFYETISFESNEAAGRHFSPGTMKWWLQQNAEAQKALLNPSSHLKGAVTAFAKWVTKLSPKADRVWAKSPEFDVVILRSAFDAVGQLWPFRYWDSRDVRTITEAAFPEGDEPTIGVGTAHNALDDAIRQALMVQACHKRLIQGI